MLRPPTSDSRIGTYATSCFVPWAYGVKFTCLEEWAERAMAFVRQEVPDAMWQEDKEAYVLC